MDNRYCDDKIWQAFNGELGVLQEQKARDRMAWIVNNARGKTAIDIGCSQGITSVLLGRKGFRVLGLDIDPNTIAFAQEKLAEENEETRKNVSFVLNDFLISYNDEDRFDTIILTEILEHLSNPDLFIRKAASILGEDGVMLITVPFGINEHPDHKQTFYGESIMRVIEKHATVISVEFYKGWIGVIAVNAGKGEKAKGFDWRNLITEEEKGFYSLEQEIRESNKRLKTKIEKFSMQLESMGEKEKQLSEKNQELEKKIEIVEDNYNQEEEQRIILENKLNQIEISSEELDIAKRDLEQRLETVQLENVHLNEGKNELKIQLEAVQLDRDQLNEAKDKLEAKLETIQTENQELKKDKKTLREQRDHLKEQRDRLSLVNKQLKEQKQKLQAELKPFRKVTKAIGKIPLAVPLYRLLKGDKERAKTYFVEKKVLKLERKLEKAKNKSKKDDKKKEELTDSVLDRFEKKTEESLTIQQKADVKVIAPNKAENIKQTQEEIKHKQGDKTDPDVQYDMDYLERISDKVVKIPESNGTRYYQRHEGKVGWLAEQFRYDAFNSAIDGVVLTPDNWKEGIKGIDFLLVTSGWRGVNNAWMGFGKPASENRQIIYQVIEACKNAGITTVFYSVEDPPNYQIFIEIAKRCDYIFTACEEVIPKYKEDCGNDKVYNLKVAINPLLHNPVGMRKFERSDKVLFAGSWMVKYPERIIDTRMLFDGVQKASRELRIIDRNLMRPEVKYRFPAEYASYVAPPVDHETLQKIHKLYDWGLTLNSVKYSRTMFANRAYEMLALGNLILSDDCTGIKTQLPTAFTCENSEKVTSILESMTPEEIYEREIAGLRFVLQKDTCFDRIKTMLDIIGRPSRENKHPVAVVIDCENPELEDSFIRQTYTDKTALKPDEWLAHAEEYDAVAFFDLKAHYGDFYLEDMMNGFKYTNCDYVTKTAFMLNGVLQYGPEHDYVSVMPDKYRTVFWKGTVQPEQLILLEGSMNLVNGYSIDHFEYDAEYHPVEKECSNTKLTVILPARNDGWYLYGKAFSSLRRDSMFDQMEIICVDIASEDNHNTAGILHMLERRYQNVKAVFLSESGAEETANVIIDVLKDAKSAWGTILQAREEIKPGVYHELLKKAEMPDNSSAIIRLGNEQNIKEMIIHTRTLEKEDASLQHIIIGFLKDYENSKQD